MLQMCTFATMEAIRLRLTDTERRRFAALAHPIGRQRFKELAATATPTRLCNGTNDWPPRSLMALNTDNSSGGLVCLRISHAQSSTRPMSLRREVSPYQYGLKNDETLIRVEVRIRASCQTPVSGALTG
jgi:hypothetical protein